MERVSKKVVFVLMLLISISSAPLFSGGAESTELPRKMGPLSMGMPENKFVKDFGIKTWPCEGCVEDEYTAAIDISKIPKEFPKYLYNLPSDKQGIDVHFKNGYLYKITFFPQEDSIKQQESLLELKYGPRTKNVDWENGISWLIWEDEKTAVALAYIRRRGDAYPLNLPVHSTYTISYIDKMRAPKGSIPN